MLKTILEPTFSYSTATHSVKKLDAQVYFLADQDYSKLEKSLEQILKNENISLDLMKTIDKSQRVFSFTSPKCPVWIYFMNEEDSSADQVFKQNSYIWSRDQAGGLWNKLKTVDPKNIALKLSKSKSKAYVSGLSGLALGLEIASYQFLKHFKSSQRQSVSVEISGVDKVQADKVIKLVKSIQQEAISVSIARHLVNLPPNECYPASIEKWIKTLSFSAKTKINVWDEKRCEKENMNLLLAVGAGAKNPPRLIHLQYRPKAKAKNPIAFVGKGVTFDSGGLDIKPSSGMRLMKKDMGGSAAVLALAYWVDQSGYDQPCDFYLSLAENSVDGNSMRPSDVYASRAGFLVEIDNTDAEGRLVLADAFNVAITHKEKPKVLIDVATLTGAIKVALGSEVAGLFSNSKSVGEALFKAGGEVGEPNWIMPLVSKYASSLNSNFADFRNSAEGFGGAITAALFLQKFTGDVPWAHLDIYAWTDRSEGAFTQVGGSGQPVQTLIQYLKSVK